MRKTIIIQALIIGAFFSCSESQKESVSEVGINEKTSKDSSQVKADIEAPEKLAPLEVKPIEWVGEEPFFFVPVNAFEKEEKQKAEEWVKEQRDLGFKACYLWIPKFESLSGTKKYAVGYGDFENLDECVRAVDSLRSAGLPGVYGLRVNQQGDRMEIRGQNKLKLNGENVEPIDENTPKVVLIFDPAVDEEASEDWGWFTAEVQSACLDKGILVEAAYEDFNQIVVKKDGLIVDQYDVSEYVENGMRGYVAIHGYNRVFIQHDMTDGILSSLSNFFGEEIPRVPIN